MIENNNQDRIIQCPNCGTRNRVRPHPASLMPRCGRCKGTLQPQILENISNLLSDQTIKIINVIVILALAGVICGIFFTPSLLRKDFSSIIKQEKDKTSELQKDNERRLAELEARLQNELSGIDPEKLRVLATEYYKKEFDDRELYDKKYALSSREKAQLIMRSIASDSTKSYHEAIVAVAREASPHGSDVQVLETAYGMALHIDFDMSMLTSG